MNYQFTKIGLDAEAKKGRQGDMGDKGDKGDNF
jgi:hypothetical protein